MNVFAKLLPINAKRPHPVAFLRSSSLLFAVHVEGSRITIHVSISAKYKEWQELVPRLIAGDIKKLAEVVDAHHRREKMLSSLRSRYESSYFTRKCIFSSAEFRTYHVYLSGFSVIFVNVLIGILSLRILCGLQP